MRLSELLNRKVVSESGQQLGRVHDVRGELVGGHPRVTGLCAGNLGILERYGIGTPRQWETATSESARPPRHPLGPGHPRRHRDRHPRLEPNNSCIGSCHRGGFPCALPLALPFREWNGCDRPLFVRVFKNGGLLSILRGSRSGRRGQL
jgi:hypothetical protein